MTQTVNPVPELRGAIPYLIVKGAADAIAWYQRSFGAELVTRLDAPDGSLIHAELSVGPQHFFLPEEHPQYGSLSPLALGGSGSMAVLYVPDADTVFARAVSAGATAKMPMGDQFWGDRSGSLVDPFGHNWFVSTHKEDLTNEQIAERLRTMMAQGGPGC
jgi:uncharacterized glyoxalase superfamily protein PhnB